MSEQEHIAAIRREAERVLDATLSGETLRGLLESKGRYDEAYWQQCRDQGWTAIGVPEDQGGIGLGLAELCVVAEAGGARAVGAPFLESGFAAAQAILRHGDQTARAQWLPRLASGEAKGLLSIAEGNAALRSHSSLQFANGKLGGRRAAVPGAAQADVGVFLASSDVGPVLVLVDLGETGVTRTPIDSFDNSRCTADLVFADVPAHRLDVDDAGAAARELVDLQAVVAAYQQLGGAQRMLDMGRDHALQRRAFGQPIGAFQSVKHRIAENYVLVELARASAGEAVASLGTPDFARAAKATRLLATDAYETCARDAIQVHGGIGATWESDLHLHQRRARSLALELGSTLAWQDDLVDALREQAA